MLDLTLQDWLNFGLAALAVLGVIVVGVIIVVLLLSMFIRVGRAKGERRPSRKSKTLTMEQKEELARQNQVERYEKQELDTGTVFEEATGKQLEEDSAVKFQEATELVDEDKTIRFSDDEPIPFLHEEEKPVTAEPAGKQAKVADKDKVDGIIKILEDYEDILDDFYKEDAIMEAEPVKPVGDISTFLGEVDRVTDESSIYTLIDGDKPAAPTQETGIVQPVDTSILTAQVSMLQFAPFKNARINNIEDARAELKELGGDIGIIQRFINQMTDQKEKDMWVRSNSDYENTESRIERKVKEWEEILGKNEAALAEQKSTLVIIEKTKELMGAETAEKDARIMALERALSEERARDVGTGEYRPDSELMVELEATKRSLIEERTRAQLLEEERNILKLAKDDSSLQEEYVHEVATLKSEITRLNRELLTKDDSGDTAALQAEISRLQREIASRDSQPVVDNSGEIEALRLQLIAEAERADNAERAAELARAEITLVRQQSDTYVINKFGAFTEEELEERIRLLEQRKRQNTKEKRDVGKEYIPLSRIEKTYEGDLKKLRRKEAIVARQNVLLYGVNNIVDIDEDKAKKLEEDHMLLDGLRQSVRHCEEVLTNNKDRLPILKSAYNVILDNERAIDLDLEEARAALLDLRNRKGNGGDKVTLTSSETDYYEE